jgi:hypothetical protein
VVGQRLARAYGILRNPLHSRRAISTIAFELGFNDLSYCNRGVSPTLRCDPFRREEWRAGEIRNIAECPTGVRGALQHYRHGGSRCKADPSEVLAIVGGPSDRAVQPFNATRPPNLRLRGRDHSQIERGALVCELPRYGKEQRSRAFLVR